MTDRAEHSGPLAPAETVAARVEAVLADPLYAFPLRHHSPTCALMLERVLRARRPRLLFLEAPAGLEALVPALVADDTRPPVALYASWRDDHRHLTPPDAPPLQRASWYPLLAYSPEYVALRIARELAAEVVFIDLPQQALAGLDAEPPESRGGPPAFADYCRQVAARAGWRHWDEAWDRLYEHGALAHDPEDWRRELATFCAIARECSGPLDPWTLARERHMVRAIREGLAARGLPPTAAMLVCGGFHLFLDHADPVAPPAALLGTEHHALVPYSYPRLSEQSGYAAGNRAPRWYERLYAAFRAGDPAAALSEQAVEVLHRARRLGEPLATADAIAVQHHATLLARLRGSRLPVLDDLDDALLSCCVKGAPEDAGARLARAAREVHIGTRVGKVSALAGQLPLVRDYHAQLDALELAGRLAHEQVEWLQLDRRQPLDAARSAFLHRLRQLGVPLATLERERHDLGHQRFGERWKLCWSAAIEATLIERSLDGDRVETAALTAFARALAAAAAHDAAASGRLLESALAMALPGLFERADAACAAALDADFRYVALVDALSTLRVLEATALEAAAQARVQALIDRAFDRACFALIGIVAAPDEEHPAILDALKAQAEAALSREDLDVAHYACCVQQAAAQTTLPGLRGALLGLLVELQQLPMAPVAAELAAHAQASPDRQIAAGDFLHGLLAVSGTSVLSGAAALVRALDALLEIAGREVFLAMLPRLRAALRQLHPRQREALAAEVARQLGLTADDIDAPLSTSAATHALIAEIDREADRILAEWSLR